MAKKKTSAASDLRSRFKATSLKKLQKAVADDDAMVGVSSNEYLNLVDGKTLKIRIFPAHPDVENFYLRKKCYWLTITKRDGEPGRTTILDSKVHGGTELDLIDEYIKFAKRKWAKDNDKIKILIGNGSKENPGLTPTFTWICYAGVIQEDSELKPKLWEFKKSVRDALNRLSFSEDDGEPIDVDPFTDPDEGLPILVKYMKNPNKKKGENYYDVNFPKKVQPRPLTDEELEYFSTLKPLTEVIPTYDKRMFDQALEGLQTFDEENEMGLFDDDAWLDIVEKVQAQYDGGDSDDDDEEETPKKSNKRKPEPEPEESEEDSDDDDSDDSDENSDDEEETAEGDEFDEMDRTELKKYIKANELDITVKKSWTDDEIRDKIRELNGGVDDDDDSDDSDENSDDEEETKPSSPQSLANIRARLKGKK